MSSTIYTAIIIGFGVVVTAVLVWRLRKFRSSKTYLEGNNRLIRFLKWEESIFLRFKDWQLKHTERIQKTGMISGQSLEILLLGLWVLWVGRDYLNFDPQMWPIGREFGVQVISHNFWNLLRECGNCALWNGSINGGFPALADTFGSAFHPFVMITTLLFGIVNGVKVATLIALWVMGISQWGISKLLGARGFIRFWSGALTIVGGHSLGRLELGAFGIMLSTSMAVLTIYSVLNFYKKKTKNATLLLALSVALLSLAGHGYFQVAILSWILIIFLLMINKLSPDTRKKFVIGLTLGLLMACVIIIPSIHFLPNVDKYGDEAGIHQALEYIPLNLVIRDWDFYLNISLAKPPFPYLTNLYISWIPVLLAMLVLGLPKEKGKPYLFMLTIGLIYFLILSSGLPFQWISKLFPFVAGIRHTQLIAGLLGPVIIGIAAYGAEMLLQTEWPSINLSYSSGKQLFTAASSWLLIIPLIFSITSSYKFNTPFIKLDFKHDIYKIIEELPNINNNWFEPPYGDQKWVLPSIERGYKVTHAGYPWWWKGRLNPAPYFQMTDGDPIEGMVPSRPATTIPTYFDPNNLYASIHSSGINKPCTAMKSGGYISVECQNSEPGLLVIQENNWVGWKAWRDGQRVNIRGEDLIIVEAIKGDHSYTFKYIPLDAYIGIGLSTIAILVCLFLWISPESSLEKILQIKLIKQSASE